MKIEPIRVKVTATYDLHMIIDGKELDRAKELVRYHLAAIPYLKNIELEIV